METYNQNPATSATPDPSVKDKNRNGRIMGGLFIIVVGVAILADRAGVDLPFRLFSFYNFLIALGLYLGFRHSFKGFAWLIPIGFGILFLIDDVYPYYDLDHYIFPIIVISIGLFIIFKPKGRDRSWRNRDSSKSADNSNEDYIDSTVIFGSVKKNVISKNFKGGDAVTIFGGTEINLNQADVEGKIVLDLTQIFAGTKLIVPAHWKIQSDDLVAIFGGIEDKRPIMADVSSVDQAKVLVLKGTCVFGGIDIKSY
jgi:hypothetical protein